MKNILLVEDEAIIALSQKMTLEKYGYSVITANSGLKAIEIFNATKDIELILMDIDLGTGIDGTETAKIILEEHEIPIVFLSSHTEPEVVEKTERITSYGYVVKNSGITVLDASIKMAFKLFYANQRIIESELTIRKKLNSIIEPGGDIGELTLGDIIDYGAVQVLMEKFYRITHIVSAIVDISGKVLVAYGWQDICTKFHRKNPDTFKNCIESDVCLSSGVPVGSFKTYKCKNNLRDIATPIEIGGKHLGNIYIGQFFYDDEIPDYELFRKQARQYGFDENEYILALEKVPRYSREIIESTMEFYSNLAELISSLSYSKIKLSRTLAQHDISLLQLKESEAKYSSYVENAPDGIFVVNEKGNYLEANEAACQITGYTKEELLQISIPDLLAEESLEKGLSHFKILLETGKSTGELIYRHKDGSTRWWAVDAVKIAESRYIGFVKDISDLKQIEAELKIKIEEIEATNEELNAAMEEMEATSEELIATNENLQTKEKILLAEKNFSEALFESIPGYLYVYDEQGNLVRWNKKHETMTGYSAEELSRMNMSDWFEGEDAVRVAAAVEEVFKTGYGDVEANLLIKGGGKLFIHSNGVKLTINGKTYFTGVGIDITEQKRIENELRKSELKYKSLIEHSTDVVFCVDKNGEYQFTNNVFASTFGKTPDYFIGKTFWDIYPKEHADFRQAATSKVFETGEAQSVEVEVPLPDKTLYFIAKANPIKNEKGEVILNLTIATDITERKMAENKIKALLVEKELLLKEVHHRIKNNMNTMLNLLSLQANSLNEPSAIKALETAKNRFLSMSVLFDKLYRSENLKKMSIANYIPSLLEEIITNFPNADSVKLLKNIEDFTIDINKIQPIGIIINELITNIMKYAFVGRSEGIITITSELKDNHAIIIVQDNGVGIPESINFGNSSGFGMELVKMLSEQIKANISIERGEGTKFILEFEV